MASGSEVARLATVSRREIHFAEGGARTQEEVLRGAAGFSRLLSAKGGKKSPDQAAFKGAECPKTKTDSGGPLGQRSQPVSDQTMSHHELISWEDGERRRFQDKGPEQPS